MKKISKNTKFKIKKTQKLKICKWNNFKTNFWFNIFWKDLKFEKKKLLRVTLIRCDANTMPKVDGTLQFREILSSSKPWNDGFASKFGAEMPFSAVAQRINVMRPFDPQELQRKRFFEWFLISLLNDIFIFYFFSKTSKNQNCCREKNAING